MLKALQTAKEILSLFFLLFMILGFDSLYASLLTLLSVVIHESGHLFAYSFFKKDRAPKLAPTSRGFKISISSLSYREELISAAFGPLFNILTPLFCMFFIGAGKGSVADFAVINILTALSNLIPIKGYDGYRISICASALLSEDNTLFTKIMERISFGLCVLFSFLSLYVMLKIGEGYWFFAVYISEILAYIVKSESLRF